MKKLYVLALLSICCFTVRAQMPAFSYGLTAGGTSDDYAYATAVDPAGNVYIGGYFQGTADLDPSAAGTAFKTATGTDAYIVKFNAAGVFQWAIQIDGASGATVTGLAADANSVYVTGSFGGTADFNPNGTTLKTSAGSADIFLARYSNTGVLGFVNQFGSTGDDLALAIALDANSNIYIGGGFSLTCDFDPATAAGSLTSYGDYDMFLAKYNSSGSYIFAVNMGSTGEDAIQSIFSNGSEVIIGGYYSNSFLYADPYDASVGISNLGNADGYYGKYSASNGALLVGGSIRSSGNDEVTSVRVQGSQLFVAGDYSASAEIFGVGGNRTLNSNGSLDGFVAAFDNSAFSINWANSFGGSGFDYVKTMNVDLGNLTIAGTFNAPMDIDPSGSTVTISNQSASYDAYFVKYTNSNGAFVTGASFGGTGDDVVYASTYNGNNYFAGAFTGTADLDPSTVSASNKLSVGGYDLFITKLVPSEPTVNPGAISFSNIGAATFNYSFTSSVNPDGYLILYKSGSAITAVPTDNVAYSVGDILGDAKVLSNGAFSGTGLASGLSQSTQYFVSVFPYNGASTSINYKTGSPVTGNTTTIGLTSEPSASPTAFVANRNATTGKYTVSWTAASGAPSGYIVLRGFSAPATDPTDGVALTAGTVLGNAAVAYVGSSLSFVEDALNAGTFYSYKVYSYNGSGGGINYRQTSPLTGSFTSYGALEPSAQPTNLQFSSVTTTSFNMSFSAAIGTNIGGYIGFLSTAGPVTFVPQDGTTYSSGQQVGTATQIVSFLGTTTSYSFGGVTPLSPNTTYYFRIYAYNGTGDQINYREVSPLTGSVKTDSPPDSDPPTVTDNSPTSAPANTPVNISVKVADASGISMVRINYSSINSTAYDEKDMTLRTGTTDVYEYTIPATYVQGPGVEYYIHAEDTRNNGGDTNYRSILISYTDATSPTIKYNAGTDQTNYSIISIPLNLSKNTVGDVFGDDLGEYNKSKYRLFQYSGGSNSELSNSSSLAIGKGYWFIAADQATIDIGAGTTVNVGYETRVEIPITTGWNLIGNPYTVDIAWSLVTGHADNADKSIGLYKTYNGGFGNGNSLKAMSGGFVMITNAGNGKLRIPILDLGGGRQTTPVNFAQSIDSETWGVDLVLKSGDYQNAFGGFGMNPTASNENDRFDDYTLPRFLDYLELNFNKKLFGSAYTKDIVPTASQHVWEFDVESSIGSNIVELSWNNSYFGNSDLQLVLWDIEQQRPVDMKRHDRYAFEKGKSRGFRVIFGSESFVKKETLPNRPVFHLASPVPSSGNVTFAFSLPESQNTTSANLSIYNMMGQKVADLVNGPLTAGYQEAVWNIEESAKPSAGVYISVLKFGDYTLQKKLIIR